MNSNAINNVLNERRQTLGMSHVALADRSGVSLPTVKRILGGHTGAASFANVMAVAEALGVSITLQEIDAQAFCHEQARKKAARIASMVQGTSAIENQAVDSSTYDQLVDRSYHERLLVPSGVCGLADEVCR